MSDLSPSAIARFVSDDFRQAHPSAVTDEMRAELAARIETALQAALAGERSACVAECTRRRDLWSSYEDRPEVAAQLRSEARARANEAAHLADALRARDEG